MKNILTSTLGIFLFLAVLIAFNAIFSQFRTLRADLTEENLYTLSDGTRKLIGELERDVTLKFYFSKSSESTPISVKQYAQRIRDLLSEYDAHGKDHVTLETYDTRPDSDEEEWAQKYGLAQQGMSILGGDPLYLGIVGVSGTREAAIPFVDPGSEPRLEYLVTRLIHEVTLPSRPEIGILSPLPIMGGEPQAPFARQQADASKWMFVSELERLYTIRAIEPSNDSIDENLAALILFHPKDISDKTLFAVDQYVLQGGHLLVFQDPMCLSDAESTPQQFGPPQSASDINRLSKAWGIEMRTGQVVGDMKSATRLSIGQGQVDRVISWLSLRDELIDRDEIATSPLEVVMMPMAGSFSGEPIDGLSQTVLLRSSEDSGQLNIFQALGPSTSAIGALDRKPNLPLAIRLQGTFKTAFPEGPPKEADGEGGTNEVEVADFLQESENPGVVVLVGDADMLHDQNCVRIRQFFGQTLAEPLNDNLNLVLNFTEQLAGSDALIGLRSRGTFERPFTKVIQLQQQAQASYQQEEQRLQATLQEAQSRLNELQQGKTADQQYILSPEQKTEIKTFNDQVFETRKQLKEVRKNLRREIESLGLRLKILNIAGVPLGIAILGTVHGIRRKKRAARIA